jgi:hypothetical protein
MFRNPSRIPHYPVNNVPSRFPSGFDSDASGSSGSSDEPFDMKRYLSEDPLLNMETTDEKLAGMYNHGWIIQIFRAWARVSYAENPKIYTPSMRLLITFVDYTPDDKLLTNHFRIAIPNHPENGFWILTTRKLKEKGSPVVMSGIKYVAPISGDEWSS